MTNPRTNLFVVCFFLLSSIFPVVGNAEQTNRTEVLLRRYGPGLEMKAGGSLSFEPEGYDYWKIKVTLEALNPNEHYWLCLNSSQNSSEKVKKIIGNIRIAGWPEGHYYESSKGREAVWDFKQIKANDFGNYSEEIALPLPPEKYLLKFFTKTDFSKGGDVILVNDHVVFEIFEIKKNSYPLQI